jgi:hypothetical protein
MAPWRRPEREPSKEERKHMPQIIVTAGDAAELTGENVMLRERINASDFESDRFATNLVERLGWAVSDAAEAEAVSDRDRDPAEEDRDRDPAEEDREAEAAREFVNA